MLVMRLTAPVIPDAAELEFAEYKPTGTVHIHQYVPPRWREAPGEADYSITFAEGLQLMSTTKQRMICGTRFRIGWGGPGEWTDCFEDDAFCVRCIRALSDQSARAFEHRRPGDPDD